MIRELRDLFDGNPELYERCGDEITNIENFWEKVSYCWPGSGKDTGEILHCAGKANEWLDGMVYHGGLLTVPSRVNDELRGLSVGQTLNFKDSFEDELPNEKHRLKLLNCMGATPLMIEGVVDAGRGCIYRADPRSWRRLLSLVGPLALVLGGGLLLFLLAGPLKVLSVSNNNNNLLVAYVLVFAGGLAHLGVSTLKDVRDKEDSSILIFHDWLMWAHIREGAIYKKVLYLWVGFLGLILVPQAASQVTLGQQGLQAAFFVGYSIDNFVDIFLSRFNQTISTRTADVSKALGK